MPLAIKTPDDYGYSVEIADCGGVGPNGTLPIPAARVAERVPDLQDATGKPLAGQALKAAFGRWAEGRSLEIANLKDADLPHLGVDITTFVAEASARDASALDSAAAAPESGFAGTAAPRAPDSASGLPDPDTADAAELAGSPTSDKE